MIFSGVDGLDHLGVATRSMETKIPDDLGE